MRKLKKVLLFILLLPLLTSCINMGSYLESRYVTLSEEVLPSVVEVIAIGLKEEEKNGWYDFFKDQEENRRDKYDSSGIGSGVIVENRGNNYYIITNNHVVGDLEKVSIFLKDKTLFTGDVIGRDKRFDLAVIKINTDKSLPVAKINFKNNLKVGQFVAALGSPMGYVQSISAGVISNIGRFGGPEGNISNFIQTDASINQGNSGGPLVNLKGEVIAINTWIASPSGGSVGLGFAIPINNIYPSFKNIVDSGKIEKSWVGISTGQVPVSEFYKDSDGGFIYQVVDNSPAYVSGLKPGDIIIKVNNKSIESSQELILLLSLLKPGDNVDLTVKRDRDELIKNLTLERAGEDVLAVSKSVSPGFILFESDENISLLEVLSKSKGQASGFRKGDIINSINGKKINKIHDLYKEIKKGLNKIVITREDQEIELELNY